MKKIILCLLLTSSLSHAVGILLDPSLGYLLGNTNELNADRSYNGINLGIKAAATFEFTPKFFVFGGLDGTYGSTNREAGGGFSEASYDEKNFGLVVGLMTPFMLRGWATYIFSSDFEDAVGNSYKGNGFRLGVGFTGLPIVSLNLEYQRLNYDEKQFGATKTRSALSGSNQLDTSAVVFSVSIPWHIKMKF
ncbi:MAG: hypothetical protein KBD63_07195 [Bacteriovoracaceae bacterium]|nr:hypothetical protein [Bacteriovoracaceae bacterium]